LLIVFVPAVKLCMTPLQKGTHTLPEIVKL
jgi:hypothetical protein